MTQPVHRPEPLRKRLDEIKAAGPTSGYIRQMWRDALQACEDGLDTAPTEQNDALPYVPVAPESLGLVLTHDSLVVDLGCLGGYGLYDFARRRMEAGAPVPRLVGVDADPVSVRVGREMAEAWARGLDVGFVEARAEALPIETGTADLVIARLLLPYVRMAAAVREMARVLKTGGVALIQVHAFRYYWSNLLARRRSPAELAYYGRPLVAGVLFALTGRQPSHRWFRETAVSAAGLERLCGRFGLAPVWRGGFRRKPIVAFRKERLTVDGKPRIRRDAIWNSGRQERKLSRASALPSWFPEFQIQSPFSIS